MKLRSAKLTDMQRSTWTKTCGQILISFYSLERLTMNVLVKRARGKRCRGPSPVFYTNPTHGHAASQSPDLLSAEPRCVAKLHLPGTGEARLGSAKFGFCDEDSSFVKPKAGADAGSLVDIHGADEWN